MRRELIGTYAIVLGGLALGLLIGVFVLDARPPILGWLFGAGAGLTGGAFVAAITSEVPLLGGRRSARGPLYGDGPATHNGTADWPADEDAPDE